MLPDVAARKDTRTFAIDRVSVSSEQTEKVLEHIKKGILQSPAKASKVGSKARPGSRWGRKTEGGTNLKGFKYF